MKKLIVCLVCVLGLTGCSHVENAIRSTDWNGVVNDAMDVGGRIVKKVDWSQHTKALEELSKDIMNAVQDKSN